MMVSCSCSILGELWYGANGLVSGYNDYAQYLEYIALHMFQRSKINFFFFLTLLLFLKGVKTV